MRLVFRHTLGNIAQRKLSFMVSALIIGFGIFLCLAVATFLFNFHQLFEQTLKHPSGIAFLSVDSAEKVQKVASQMMDLPSVQKIDFLSPKQAASYLAGAGVPAALLEDPDLSMPWMVMVYGGFDQVAAQKETFRKVSSIEGVDEVVYLGDDVMRLKNMFNIGAFAAALAAILVSVLTLFVVSAFVRLSISSRLPEIEIMRLVGATEKLIVTPFLLEGLLLGMLGSAVGFLLLRLCQSFAVTHFAQAELLPLEFLLPSFAAVLCLAVGSAYGSFRSH